MSETTEKPAELKPGMIVRFMPEAFTGLPQPWECAAIRPARGKLVRLDYSGNWMVRAIGDFCPAEQWVDQKYLIPEESTVSTTDNPELEAFKKKVRDAVIAEAKAQGWGSRTDGWLEELGLEPWRKIPEAIGAVVECRDDSTCGTYYAVHKGYNNWQCFAGTTMRAYDSDIWKDFVSVVFDPSA